MTRYPARHAAPYDARRCREATTLGEGYLPRHANCPRCTPPAFGPICRACAAEVEVSVLPGSTMTRPDVRLLPLTGPQAGWQ